MHLVLDDDYIASFHLYPGIFEHIVSRWLKHLRHVDIPWRPWEYIPMSYMVDIETVKNWLNQSANKLGLAIDQERELDQTYLNELHVLYEKNYDGTQKWSDFHEPLHVIERKHHQTSKPVLEINYRHLAGPLKLKFDPMWLHHGTTEIAPGEIFLAWDELGKIPYTYWRDKEPDDLYRMCELSKPWLWLRPKFHIAFDFIDFVPAQNSDFQKWYEPYRKNWCAHWGLQDWSLTDMFTVIPVGKMNQAKRLEAKIRSGCKPKRLQI